MYVQVLQSRTQLFAPVLRPEALSTTMLTPELLDRSCLSTRAPCYLATPLTTNAAVGAVTSPAERIST